MMSDNLKSVIDFFEQARKDYKYASDQLDLCDKETQDILHSLELDDLSLNEKRRMATRLSRVRKKRRENKNIIELYQPLYDFLTNEQGKRTYNLLREILGKVRKTEEYHRTRTYHKKAKEEILS